MKTQVAEAQMRFQVLCCPTFPAEPFISKLFPASKEGLKYLVVLATGTVQGNSTSYSRMASTFWANEALFLHTLHITGKGACHLTKAGVEETAVNINIVMLPAAMLSATTQCSPR